MVSHCTEVRSSFSSLVSRWEPTPASRHTTDPGPVCRDASGAILLQSAGPSAPLPSALGAPERDPLCAVTDVACMMRSAPKPRSRGRHDDAPCQSSAHVIHSIVPFFVLGDHGLPREPSAATQDAAHFTHCASPRSGQRWRQEASDVQRTQFNVLAFLVMKVTHARRRNTARHLKNHVAFPIKLPSVVW